MFSLQQSAWFLDGRTSTCSISLRVICFVLFSIDLVAQLMYVYMYALDDRTSSLDKADIVYTYFDFSKRFDSVHVPHVRFLKHTYGLKDHY